MCQKSQESGEGVQSRGHVGLEIGCSTLRPNEVADDVRDGGAAEDDKRDLKEGLESPFFDEAENEDT